MPQLPPKHQQIIQTHAALIVKVVEVCGNREQRPHLEKALDISAQNGWDRLVAAIRQILDGKRDRTVLAGLDEEDAVVVEAILRGLQDPGSLPDPNAKPDPSLAAPGLAAMIHASATGNAMALKMLADMAEQMSKAGGEMTRLGGIMRHMVNGERDPDVLTKGMGSDTRQLVLRILEELSKLTLH